MRKPPGLTAQPLILQLLSTKSLLGIFLCLALSSPGRAVMPSARQIVVVDSQADPFSDGDARGAGLVLSYDSLAVHVATAAVGMVDPHAMVLAADQLLAVADASADPLGIGGDTGALLFVDPTETLPGQIRYAIATPLFRNPVDLLAEPSGTLLLLDKDADPKGWGSPVGAVFRCTPLTRGVQVLASPPEFSEPRGMTLDLDGQLLVVDQGANPLALHNGAGAVFRIDRLTGASTILAVLTNPPFVTPVAVAVLPSGPHRGDLLILDANADPAGRGNSPGAVFRLPRNGGAAEVFADPAEFRDPTDILIGTDHDVLVLDRTANPDQLPGAAGAVFRFDLGSGAALQRWTSGLFQSPEGLFQRSGPDLDASSATWTNESHPFLQPGDLITIRTELVNTGTDGAADIAVVDSLSSAWLYVAGSDSIGAGASAFDPAGRVWRWNGSLPTDGRLVLRFRVRLKDDVPPASEVENGLIIQLGQGVSRFHFSGVPLRDFPAGTRVFVDIATVQAADQGRLYSIDPASRTPTLLWGGTPLKRPSDTAFLEDGRVAILDTGSPAGDLGAILLYHPTGRSGDVMTTLMPLRLSDGLVAPSGIAVDRDGSLLLIDRDANPMGFAAPNDRCGAVFRLDPKAQAWAVVASDQDWKQPLDAVSDRRGNLLLVDPGAAPQDPAILWEIERGASSSRPHVLPSDLFRDPTGLCVDASNNLFVADPSAPGGTHPQRGALIKVTRGSLWSFSTATQDTLLRQPVDCAMDPTGVVLIADREANPLRYTFGDRGAVLRWNPSSGIVTTAAATSETRQPDGVAVLGAASLSRSTLDLRAAASGDLVAGDTLHCSLMLVNGGTAAAPAALAQMEFTPSVGLDLGSASAGELTLDLIHGQASWTGRLALDDSVRVDLRGRVLPGVAFGDVAGVSSVLAGGTIPVTLARTRKVRASFPPNDLVIADETANPLRIAQAPGALFRLGNPGRTVQLIVSQVGLMHPTCMEWNKDGELVVGATQGLQPGALFRFDVNQGLIQLGNTNPRMRTPVDLLYTSAQDLLIVDRDSPGPTPASRGTIFRLPHNAFLPAVFSADSLYRSPMQITPGPGGRLYLVDAQANPGGSSGRRGAIFTLDSSTGQVLDSFQSDDFTKPTGIVAYDDSTLLVTDQTTHAGGAQMQGALFTYQPALRRLRLLVAEPLLRSPKRSLILPSGEILIMDQEAVRPGQVFGAGAVFDYDPVSRSLRGYSWCDSFSAVSDIVQKPGALVRFSEYSLEDLNGPPLRPSDQIRVRVLLRSTGRTGIDNLAWADTLPSGVSLLPATASASTGTLHSEESGILRWAGDLGTPDSVLITYDLQLNPAMTEGRFLVFRSSMDVPGAASQVKTASIHIFSPLEPGFLYALDSEARPYGEPQGGAIFKVNMVTGFTVPMYTSPLFRRPRSIALVGVSHPRFLILDDQVTPGRGLGGLFALDPVTQEMNLLASDSTWVSPRKVVAASDNEAYVLDVAADPFDLLPGSEQGPGAIYRVDLASGATTPVFSDTSWKSPVSLAILGDGRLLVCAQGVDPGGFGTKGGALFTVDLDSLKLRTYAVSPDWRRPVAVAVLSDSNMVLIDQLSPPGTAAGQTQGAMYRISAGGGWVGPALTSTHFRQLVDVQIGARGRPILCDASADPFLFGGEPGAIFQSDPQLQTRIYPLASDRSFRALAGIVAIRDYTPVEGLRAEATTDDEGIHLRWQGAAATPGVRFLVYRREAEGPDDPGDPAPVNYLLVSAGEEFLGPGPHEFLDRAVEGGIWYVYLLAQVSTGGAVDYSSPIVARASNNLTRLELAPPQPNPFRGETVLLTTIPRPGGEASLSIFDVTGRRVRVLLRGAAKPGRLPLVWDGRDERGHPLGAGLFWARLRYGDQVRTARLVRLR